MNGWYTISELEEKTGIPHQTIRRYLDRHSHHFTMKKKHKSYLIYENSIEVIEKIRNLYGRGFNADQVDEDLSLSGIPIEYVVEDENNVITTMGKAFENMQQSMRELNHKYEKQEQFNQSLLEQMKRQQEYISNKLEERDKKLIESLREMQETRKQVASAQEEEKEEKKGWFARLFGM